MKVPAYLKHKPVLEVADYDQLDGPYADAGDTDAKGLSIGIAQWNSVGSTELSAKVWRHTGGKWSRQSEELPLHRVIDLATLICIAIDYCRNGNSLTSSDEFPVTRSTENLDFQLHRDVLKRELEKNKDYLDSGLKRLSKELKKLGY